MSFLLFMVYDMSNMLLDITFFALFPLGYDNYMLNYFVSHLLIHVKLYFTTCLVVIFFHNNFQ